jgi:hypothetical protein
VYTFGEGALEVYTLADTVGLGRTGLETLQMFP